MCISCLSRTLCEPCGPKVQFSGSIWIGLQCARKPSQCSLKFQHTISHAFELFYTHPLVGLNGCQFNSICSCKDRRRKPSNECGECVLEICRHQAQTEASGRMSVKLGKWWTRWSLGLVWDLRLHGCSVFRGCSRDSFIFPCTFWWLEIGVGMVSTINLWWLLRYNGANPVLSASEEPWSYLHLFDSTERRVTCSHVVWCRWDKWVPCWGSRSLSALGITSTILALLGWTIFSSPHRSPTFTLLQVCRLGGMQVLLQPFPSSAIVLSSCPSQSPNPWPLWVFGLRSTLHNSLDCPRKRLDRFKMIHAWLLSRVFVNSHVISFLLTVKEGKACMACRLIIYGTPYVRKLRNR